MFPEYNYCYDALNAVHHNTSAKCGFDFLKISVPTQKTATTKIQKYVEE